MLGVGLERAGANPFRAPMRAAEASDVGVPQVVRRRPVHDPFGQRHSGAAAGGDAEGVEAGTDEAVAELGGFAEDEHPVRREALGTVDQLVDPDVAEPRHTSDRELHDRREMVPVGVEQLEREVVGHACHPRLRVRLVATHHEPADLLLVIGQTVGIAQRRQVARDIHRFGDDVLVLDRHERHGDADRGRQLPRPLPGAQHHDLAVDPPAGGDHARDASVDDVDPLDRGVLDDRRPGQTGTLGERHRDVARIRLAIGRAARRRRPRRRRPSAARSAAPRRATAGASRARTTSPSWPGA